MKKALVGSAFGAVMVLTVARSAVAQGPGPGGGGRMYDPNTVDSLSGTVMRVEVIDGGGRSGGGHGVHLVLKTDKEEIAVHLGPSWYVDSQPIKLAAGDRIDVRGSRITLDGKPVIIAATVKKGDQTIELRDAAGLPAWRGRGRRGP